MGNVLLTPGQPAAKKTRWWIWGLLGCGGLIVLIVVMAVAGGAYLWNKAPKTELEATAAFDQAPKKIPSWVPAYPGVTPTGGMSDPEGDQRGGLIHLITTDSPGKVIAFYKEKFAEQGLQAIDEKDTMNSGLLGFTARSEDGKKFVHVTAMRFDEDTAVSVSYEEKSE